ncbi:Kae1-associated kinase Bud32 [Candidatus Bathyarchaeota archaeon]|nr:Kae1-associated kinase Bud32 [Candidatus Bathyarchaeota archaeon]
MLIKKGAEASIFLEDWQGQKVIMKHRLPKKYRLPQIDERIRSYRTIHESQLLHCAKEAGVSTPMIYSVDLADSNIIMEFIEGIQVKQVLNDYSTEERKHLSNYIGKLIGSLHLHDIIHGDLTTSNMILNESGNIVFVDFGLGEISVELESKGVDLHLMKRAFQSTHFRYAEECFKAVLEGYTKMVGVEMAKKVIGRISEIERRGRYVSERKGRVQR